MILTALTTLGLNFVKDLIQDKGEDLVTEGIRKVTGIDISKEKELSEAQIRFIKDHELEIKKLDFEKLKLQYDQKNTENKEITARHENDMKSDSKLSKNIRPLALIYLMFLFTLAFIMEVSSEVLEMLGNLLTLVFMFYFGARTIEKVASMVTTKGSNNG
jgi:cation transport ATPase